MNSNITVGLRDSGPVRTGIPQGVAVSLGSAGLGGDFVTRMQIPSTGFSVAEKVTVPSFGNKEVFFTVDPIESIQFCDMTIEVIQGEEVVASRRTRVELLPRFCFDRLSDDFVQSICDTVKETTEIKEDKNSISGDIIDLYNELEFILLTNVPDGRYLNLTPPDIVPEYGDGSKADVAVTYLSKISSKGYFCCLVSMDGDMFVGVSNESRRTADIGKLLDSYIFIRPSDSCQGIDATVSMDLSKTALRLSLKQLKNGRDIGYID